MSRLQIDVESSVLLSEFSAHDDVCVVNGGTAMVEYYCLPVNEMEVDS